VVAAVAATALGVGGVVVGSQLVSAGDGGSGDDTAIGATTVEDTTVVDETVPVDDDSGEGVDDDGLDDDRADSTERTGDDTSEDPGDLGDLGDLGGLGELLDQFERCFSFEIPDFVDDTLDHVEELPDIGWDHALDELLGRSVTVVDPSTDELLRLFEFGDGDGTITVTQKDGKIEVTTDGDVETVDPELSFELPDLGLGTHGGDDTDGADGADDPDDADADAGDEAANPDDAEDAEDAAPEDCELTLPDGGFLDGIFSE